MELDIPCQYGYVNRTGKPKGSRNRKTLEKVQRLREEYELRNEPYCSRPISQQSFQIEGNALGTSHQDQTPLGRECTSPLETTHISPFGTEFPAIQETIAKETSSLSERMNDEALFVVDDQLGQIPSIALSEELESPGSARFRCSCFTHHLQSMTQLYNLSQKHEKDRFDLGMQSTTEALSSCRAIIQCQVCRREPHTLFLALWAIRLVCGWFLRRASTQNAPFPGANTGWDLNQRDDRINFRCGDYSIPAEQSSAVCEMLFLTVVRNGLEILRLFRSTLDSDEVNMQASGPSLATMDETYMRYVITHCEESLAKILYPNSQVEDSSLPGRW